MKKAPVEIDSARQLELLDEALAGSKCGQEGLVVANDDLRRASASLEALPAVPAKLSAPHGGLHATADRAALTKPSTGEQSTLPRLSVSPGEAAEMLGVSRDYFDEHLLHELRIVRRGRRILIALAELERWLDRAATIRGSLERRTGKAANARVERPDARL
jgi:excisionase family DNA binding protein